jgi:peptidoglycan/LPS O-acetylase OafA/YrhL
MESVVRNKPERVGEIDLLRFIAAIMVVFFHYFLRGNALGDIAIRIYPKFTPFCKYGFLGVQLFS